MESYEGFLSGLTVEGFGGARRPQPDAAAGARSPASCEGASSTVEARSPAVRARQNESSLGKLLLRVEEAADLLGVGRTRVNALIGSGALHSVKIGGSRRVPAAALHEYVEDLTDEP